VQILANRACTKNAVVVDIDLVVFRGQRVLFLVNPEEFLQVVEVTTGGFCGRDPYYGGGGFDGRLTRGLDYAEEGRAVVLTAIHGNSHSSSSKFSSNF